MTHTPIKIRLANIRLPKDDKNYWLNQLQSFADRLDSAQISAVEFGKQDIRGANSITLVDHRHCVPFQMHFSSKDAMLGYVQGSNCDDFKRFGKE